MLKLDWKMNDHKQRTNHITSIPMLFVIIQFHVPLLLLLLLLLLFAFYSFNAFFLIQILFNLVPVSSNSIIDPHSIQGEKREEKRRRNGMKKLPYFKHQYRLKLIKKNERKEGLMSFLVFFFDQIFSTISLFIRLIVWLINCLINTQAHKQAHTITEYNYIQTETNQMSMDKVGMNWIKSELKRWKFCCVSDLEDPKWKWKEKWNTQKSLNLVIICINQRILSDLS